MTGNACDSDKVLDDEIIKRFKRWKADHEEPQPGKPEEPKSKA